MGRFPHYVTDMNLREQLWKLTIRGRLLKIFANAQQLIFDG